MVEDKTLSTMGPMASPAMNKLLAHTDIVFALGLAVVLATLMIPLPTFLLDMLLATSISISLATLIVVLSSRESIEFSSFPSLLLFLTLFRLSLNVASTRLILLQGSAGQIINTFGNFVAGGNLVIGLVVFLILVVIQFVVITKGSERISEVAARFNLDAMPGKQMAIDADLSAGAINDVEAKARREKIVRESEFFGAMDGASKFIRGDAIAGLLIAAVNLVGGFVVGMSRGLTPAESVKTYAILAIGDGLVSQIPAVLISTASGFLVSKTSTKANLSVDLVRQLLARSRPLGIAAFLFAAMAFVPGFPMLPFLVLSGGTALLVRALSRQEARVAKAKEAPKPETEPEAAPDELLDSDQVSLQVGVRLIKTIDPRRKSSLSTRVTPLRRKFAQQYGILLPLIRLRDNVALAPNGYEIRLHDHVVASGNLEPDMLLAMDGGAVRKPVKGVATREPVFGLPALWVPADMKEEAEMNGYTVVDPESVLVTHMAETLKRHAGELVTHDDVQKLVDRLRSKYPSLVGSVVGEHVSLGLLHRVLQNLLKDRIPIRDLPRILEALGDHAGRIKDPVLLTEHVRKALLRTLTEQNVDGGGKITALTFEPSLEYELRNALRKDSEGGTLALPPEQALEICRRLGELWRAASERGAENIILLCDATLRLQVSLMVSRQFPQLPVLAYDEIVAGTKIESVGTISLAPALPAGREMLLAT
ncbi:MAG: flagellar biosynthesis protein FlhA [Phycisphaerae bacterium]|jgi:flagellar biosynthesis protein FlhA